MNKYIVLSLTTFLAACSVKPSAVVNEPPVIRDSVISFATETGTLEATGTTLFLWPAQWSEEEARVGTAKINAAAREYGKASLDITKAQMQVAQLWGASVYMQCATNFSVTPIDGVEAQLPETELLFVDATTVAPEKTELYQKCVENQSTRTFVKGAIADIQQTRALPSIGAIMMTLDKDPSNPQNWKSIKSAKFVIGKNADGTQKIEVYVEGFLGVKKKKFKDQSSVQEGPAAITNVSYNPQARVLNFSVPAQTNDGELTGEVYDFSVERVGNVFEYKKPGKDADGNDIEVLVEIAAFKGDVQVKVGGKTVRLGSAQFSGEWIP